MNSSSVPRGGEQILLPFAQKEWVSVNRACKILGIGKSHFYRLRDRTDAAGLPLIDTLNCGVKTPRLVLYASLVRFCDGLRERYAIPDRRPPLDNPIFRYRDEDLLPFPIADTMGTPEALTYTHYDSLTPLQRLVEEGRFEAYRFVEAPGWEWRISRSSFARWIAEVMPPRR